MKRLLILSALTLLGACATGPVFDGFDAAPDGAGRVYVYQTRSAAGALRAHDLIYKEKMVGRIANGGYLSFTLPPGYQILFAKDCGKNPVVLDVAGGVSYFVEVRTFLVRGEYFCAFEERDPAEGGDALNGLRRLSGVDK